MDTQQLEFARAHGITRCPPAPECLGFGLRDWVRYRNHGFTRGAEAEYRSQPLRWHGDPVRRHYWQLARLGGKNSSRLPVASSQYGS